MNKCLECGQDATSTIHRGCKNAWNNRRRKRGAVLYDLYMAHRLERDAATEARVLTKMNRLAAQWAHEDEHERGGRRSYRRLADVLKDMPHLAAVYRGRITGGRAAGAK